MNRPRDAAAYGRMGEEPETDSGAVCPITLNGILISAVKRNAHDFKRAIAQLD
jgi:hypothetical protein